MDHRCEYCTNDGIKRLDADNVIKTDTYACDQCWKLLKNPITAIPLLRGHMNLTLRDKVNSVELKKLTDVFVKNVIKWKPSN